MYTFKPQFNFSTSPFQLPNPPGPNISFGPIQPGNNSGGSLDFSTHAVAINAAGSNGTANGGFVLAGAAWKNLVPGTGVASFGGNVTGGTVVIEGGTSLTIGASSTVSGNIVEIVESPLITNNGHIIASGTSGSFVVDNERNGSASPGLAFAGTGTYSANAYSFSVEDGNLPAGVNIDLAQLPATALSTPGSSLQVIADGNIYATGAGTLAMNTGSGNVSLTAGQYYNINAFTGQLDLSAGRSNGGAIDLSADNAIVAGQHNVSITSTGLIST